MPDSPAPAPSPTKRPKPAKLRPHGRSLADFPDRTPAEEDLLRCARLGIAAVISDKRPEEKPENFVRAGLVRFLALGGDDRAPVHEHGVHLEGAWVEGELDLDGARCAHRLTLVRCRLEQVIARFAVLGALRLTGCRLDGALLAERARIEGSLFLDKGFVSHGLVQLAGAQIGGDLGCADGHFVAGTGNAVVCDDASVAGNLFLVDGFHAEGEIRLLGATIAGDLVCGRARLDNAGGNALSLDRAKIGGGVFMQKGFHAEGAVRLHGASINGNVECDGGRFNDPRGTPLALEGATIGGNIFLRDGFHSTGELQLIGTRIGGDLDCTRGRFENPTGTALHLLSMDVGESFVLRSAHCDGVIDLSAARVSNLMDDRPSWERCRKRLVLQGFSYDRFSGLSPVDADSRIAWLDLQSPEHLGSDFAPQPWEQLAAVLKGSGHADAARKVAVAKHQRMRKAKRYVGGSWTWDLVYGALVGYGYRPRRLLFAILGVWLFCTLVYLAAANPRWFGSEHYLLMPVSRQPDPACLAGRAAAPCPLTGPRHEDLFLPAYSAEVLIPVVSLGAKGEWKPVARTPEGEFLPWGVAVRGVYWFEILFGWLASLLLVAAVGNLIKKD